MLIFPRQRGTFPDESGMIRGRSEWEAGSPARRLWPRQDLDDGEGEAIALAVETDSHLLIMDEQHGRTRANHFEIATKSETSVNELVDALVPVLREAGIEDVEVTNTEPRVGDVRRNYSDTSKAQSMLGWKAQVDLTAGFRCTVADLVPSAELETGEAVRR